MCVFLAMPLYQEKKTIIKTKKKKKKLIKIISTKSLKTKMNKRNTDKQENKFMAQVLWMFYNFAVNYCGYSDSISGKKKIYNFLDKELKDNPI